LKWIAQPTLHGEDERLFEPSAAKLGSKLVACWEAAVETATNKELCRRFFVEVVSQGALGVIDEICAPEYRLHATLSGPDAIDREALKELVTSWRSSFPDGQISVEEMVAENDLVAARMLERGTHLGEFSGIPPTGRAVSYGSMTFMRVVDGRITDHWGLLDMPSLLQQIRLS